MSNLLSSIVSSLGKATPGTNGSFRLAKLLVFILQHNDVAPEETFTAVAGADYGTVSAWSLGDSNGYAVAYGDNGYTSYDLTGAIVDLGQHLIHQDLSGTDLLIEQANIYGAGRILADCPDTAEGPFALIASRNYYGHIEVSSVVTDDRGDELTYQTWAEAKAAMDDLEVEEYVTEHNESGRPTYYIVEV